MKIDMVIDLGWGSSGKGGIVGHMSMTDTYRVAVCSYGRQSGHTYKSKRFDVSMVVQQLPVSIVSPNVVDVFLGPGSLIHEETLRDELNKYSDLLKDKNIWIHGNAAVINDSDVDMEVSSGMSKMGSTTKGVGAAMIRKINRNPDDDNTAKSSLDISSFENVNVLDSEEYSKVLIESMYVCHSKDQKVMVEGAQGFGLSIHHGFWPYVTSRDVTPSQIWADCGLPFKYFKEVRVIGVARTLPIRVNNRDGWSGPCYPDQHELSWKDLNIEPERTTVTKLERRIFSFSERQLLHACNVCMDYKSQIALTFCDYADDIFLKKIRDFIHQDIGIPIGYEVYGPDHDDVKKVSL